MATSSTTARRRPACATATTASRCGSSRRAHERQHARLNAVRPPPVVELRAVAKSFAAPAPRRIFTDLSLEIARGEHVAIVGASGIGKSTLLNVVAGLEPVDAGSVVVDGVDVATLDDDARTAFRRERMGFVFQAFHVLPYLSVAENVALPLALLAIGGAPQSARVREMLDAVGLAGRGQSRPRELSGGELQRVAIARALVHRPALVLADEPTGNLDPDTGRRVIALLREAVKSNGAAVVLATHSRTAAAAADRIYRLTATGLQPASAEDVE
jgi:putative ABC transport system ATP-binding protein